VADKVGICLKQKAVAKNPGLFFTTAVACLYLLESTSAADGINQIQVESGFVGPGSVSSMLQKDSQIDASALLEMSLLERFKNQAKSEYGLNVGLDYNLLMQQASQSPGEDTAIGGVFRFYGDLNLNRDSKGDLSSVVYKIENRHAIGGKIAPQSLGGEIGYAGLTAVTFSDKDWMLTNLYLNRHLIDDRLGIVVGVVDVTDYTDVYGLVNVWTDFNNYAFTTSPTIPAPNQGLGAAMSWMLNEHYYVFGGIADANGDPTNLDDMFDSSFNTAEFFSHIEFGWIGSYKTRYSDNIHVTLWHADAREEAGTSGGWGTTCSASRFYEGTWEPFFRAGYSDGGGSVWERSVSTGLGYHLNANSILGLGANWSRPSDDVYGPRLNDQWTYELYYRWQVSKHFAITPDLQLLVEPANNPTEDIVAIFGLRARITF